MAKQLLTNEEVAKAIHVDPDYPRDDLQALAQAATSFVHQKTGYKFAEENPIEPLAKQCAKLYVRQLHYGAEGYNKEHDYSLGIASLIEDLKDLARKKSS